MRYSERKKSQALLILFLTFILQFSLPQVLSARRIKQVSLSFFQGKQSETLNTNLSEFILSLPGVTKVESIVRKTFLEGDFRSDDEDSLGAYRFDVLTNEGIISLIVKPIREEDAHNFEAASLIGVAPHPAQFIPAEHEKLIAADGYLVYPSFEGQKLSKICAQENGAQIIKENPWIIEQLAIKFAHLKQKGINYKDFFYYNTIVDLNRRNLAIIDFGRRGCADPYVQITQWWLPGLFYSDPVFKKEAMEIFEENYQANL